VLVCPSCRNENLEEAGFCRVCGRSLEPVGSYMRRLDRDQDDELALDVPAPRTGPPWMALGLVVLVMLGVAGWAVFSTAQPDPCRGRFSSSLYPYCAEIPEGWEGGAALDGTETIDRFVRDSQEVDAVANVRVEQVIDPTVQTQQYAQQFRTSQEADGLDPSQAEVVDLDGEQALAWNYTVAGTGPAEPPLLIREVVMVRAEGAWRVTLIATEDVYQDARIAFERLLNSWRWKS
jgi:hypothetical protein